MNIWKRLTARFGTEADMLRSAPSAKPSAEEWLVAFAENVIRHFAAARATKTLMSSLRFFTAEFLDRIASQPSPETRRPPIGGSIPRAIYAATGPIVEDVFQRLISRHSRRGQNHAGFAQTVPVLADEYDRSMR